MSDDSLLQNTLLRSHEDLVKGVYGRGLDQALASVGVDVSNAYVISWLPEQFEDIYEVMVSCSDIVIIEISRENGGVQESRESVRDYMRRCSKEAKRKIFIVQSMLMGAE